MLCMYECECECVSVCVCVCGLTVSDHIDQSRNENVNLV